MMPFKIGIREIERYEEIETEDGIELVETPEWQSYEARIKLENKIKLANVNDIDRDYVGSDAQGNLSKLEKYTQGFTSSDPKVSYRFRTSSLYLWSRRNGTQKSTMARRLGRDLIRAGFSVHMLLMSDLSSALTHQGFEDEDAWLLETLDAVDLLIVDDAFDPKKITLYRSGYQIPFLDTFLRRRLEANKKAICFTSNIPIDSIGDTFGPSIQSLVKRSAAPLEFTDGIDDFDIKDLWK